MTRTGLRLILDVSFLTPQPSGIGRYTLELARRLPEQLASSDRLSYWTGHSIVPRLPPVPRPITPRWRRRVQRWLSQGRLRSEVFHGPNFFLPQGTRNGVITVHDLSVLLHPDTHPQERLRDYDLHFTRSVNAAKHIITGSETTRQEVISTLGVPSSRVTTVYHGVSARFRPHALEELGGLAAWKLQPGSYGLCVAALEPRKKLTELLQSWRALPNSLRDRFPLVLAGAPGWPDERIKETVEVGTSEGWLKALGFVPEEQLPALYAGAALFLYPSIYEGFGLPPLEAMASGVPVMVADRSCLPEICGDAPRFIDPDDIASFSAAIAEALEDQNWHIEAVRKGLVRAAQFTWDRCVDQTIAVYRKVAGGS